MAALHKALRMTRVVIVTPSVYGTDNSATLFGMKARGADARGVAVIDDKTTESELDAMHQAGMRGIRRESRDRRHQRSEHRPASACRRRSTGCKARGWHVQIYTNLAMIAAFKDQVAASPVPIVFDHFGGAQAGPGVQQPGFPDLRGAGPRGQGLREDLAAPIAPRRQGPTIRTSRRSPGR